MTILALEFSSEQRSVAVARGTTVLAGVTEAGARRTAAFDLIERTLAQANLEREEIEAIAVGLGPGSYTGVRAAIALAQGWQLACGARTTGVSSVAAIAAAAQAEKVLGRVNVVVDAQREEFYLAVYEIQAATIREVETLRIAPVADLQFRAREGQVFVGPEAARHFSGGRAIFPSAAAVSALAAGQERFLPAEKLAPIYLREANFVKAIVHAGKPAA